VCRNGAKFLGDLLVTKLKASVFVEFSRDLGLGEVSKALSTYRIRIKKIFID